MDKLIIIGAGGFGRETAWLVERINKVKSTWEIVGFLDDVKERGQIINSYPVLGKIEDAAKYPNAYFACAIGNAKARRRIIENLTVRCPNIRFAILIDPTVEISPWTDVGEGSIICAQTIITVNAKIGRHVIVNLDCTIGHDAVLEDYVTLYPSVNVSGMTKIGKATELGTGTQIIQGRTIAPGSVIGAGAVVIRDMENSCTAVGVPAKWVHD